jgi:hypothetical protein
MKMSSMRFRLFKNKEMPDVYWKVKALLLVAFALGLLLFALYNFSALFNTETPFIALQKNLRRAERAYEQHDLSRAIDKAYAARGFAITLGDTDHIVEAVLLEAKARLLLQDTAEGTKLIQDVITIAERDQKPLFRAKTYAAIMEVYAKQGEYVKAITASKQVVFSYNNAKDPEEAARLIMVLADKIFVAEPTAALTAITLYEESLDIYKKNMNYLMIGLVRERMGAALLKTDQQKAISYYLDAMEVYKSIDNNERRDAVYKILDAIDPKILQQYYD